MVALGIIAVIIYGFILYFSGCELASFLCHNDSEKTITLTERFGVVGATLTGLALILTALFIKRRAEAHETENDNELFNVAISHLGNFAESVRLGGIYALYKLAHQEQYTQSVHEILCSHLRSKTTENEYQKNYQHNPSTEIESLLKLLANQSNCERFSKLSANLNKAYLHGAILCEAQLQAADLILAQLQAADLSDVQLQGVYSLDVNRRAINLDFQSRIEARIGKNAELDGVIFSGGISQDDFHKMSQASGINTLQTVIQVRIQKRKQMSIWNIGLMTNNVLLVVFLVFCQ